MIIDNSAIMDTVKTVQVNLEEPLIEEVDRAAAELGVSRSAFTREALRSALARLRTRAREERHRSGYRQHPVEPGELERWEKEQVWPD